jgi:hypothetical protein
MSGSDDRRLWFVEKFYGGKTGWMTLWLHAYVSMESAKEVAMDRKRIWPKERLRVAGYCRDVAVGITKKGLQKGNPV